MRLSVRSTTVAAGALLLAGLNTGTAVAAPQEGVTGSATIDFFGISGRAILTAHGNPTDAHGNIKFRVPETFLEDVDATVDCVNIVGNLAIISGPLDRPNPTFGWTFIQVTVLDNGAPANGSGPDLVSTVQSHTDLGCTTAASTPVYPVQRGNFTVKDR